MNTQDLINDVVQGNDPMEVLKKTFKEDAPTGETNEALSPMGRKIDNLIMRGGMMPEDILHGLADWIQDGASMSASPEAERAQLKFAGDLRVMAVEAARISELGQ